MHKETGEETEEIIARNAIRNWKLFLLYLVQIFASDISLAAVEKARGAVSGEHQHK